MCGSATFDFRDGGSPQRGAAEDVSRARAPPPAYRSFAHSPTLGGCGRLRRPDAQRRDPDREGEDVDHGGHQVASRQQDDETQPERKDHVDHPGGRRPVVRGVPVDPIQLREQQCHEARERGDPQQPEVDHRLEGVRILVVDDDIGICSTLKELLQAAGCKVETAHNGAEGLEKVASSHFDVVLSDVVMPNMDGYEFYQAIRERLPELPVLMMTAFHYDKDHIIKRSRLKGLEGVIFKKPVDPERLLEVIAETARGESG